MRRQVETLERAVQMPQAQRPDIDGLFIEILTRAGEWNSAAQVAQRQIAAIPDDAWNKSRKLTAQQVRAATELEAALASGDVGRVTEFSAEWKRINEDIERDRIENEERRDPLRGLLRQNQGR
jgi:hypothetical protein